ncbi:homeobox protein dbx-like protein [Dinothrombium tinctorium]|uniref:Homeobox protein dbx-like protein n=1 Tax=Dinothrombium tinctorium TaxID=1965070 RepID=A0A443RP14_9ACAR|nr:homeobox protein dbx-like protein [Dinothrombium tinctorium]
MLETHLGYYAPAAGFVAAQPNQDSDSSQSPKIDIGSPASPFYPESAAARVAPKQSSFSVESLLKDERQISVADSEWSEQQSRFQRTGLNVGLNLIPARQQNANDLKFSVQSILSNNQYNGAPKCGITQFKPRDHGQILRPSTHYSAPVLRPSLFASSHSNMPLGYPLSTLAWMSSARGKPRRGMMRRAVFSDAQRQGLEKRFQLQKYISKPDRKKLAEELGLKDSQLLSHGGTREQTLPTKNNPNPDLTDVGIAERNGQESNTDSDRFSLKSDDP